MTYEADGYRTYMNGEQKQQGWMIGPVLTGYPVTIGAVHFGDSSFLLGNMDEVRIYNRVLTNSEIAELYAQVNPVPVPGAFLLGAIGLGVAGLRLRRNVG